MADVSFNFTSDAPNGNNFTVLALSGSEGLSRLYRYEIDLKAPAGTTIDLDEVLDNTAHLLKILDDGTEYPVHGMLASFDEHHTVQDYTYYSAVLVPRIWRMSVCRTNEIYTTEKTVDRILETVLTNAGFSSGYDFDTRGLSGSFLQRDYVCQFRESDFDFIARLMENEGIYFYFQHKPDGETMIIANDAAYHPLPEAEAIFDAGAPHQQRGRQISSLSCRKQRMPFDVTVRDYNPEQPSLDLASRGSVDARGFGTEYLYGEHVADEDEAAQLASIRAEEFNCRKTRFYGEGSIPGFLPGFTFHLDRHPNPRYDQRDYLLVEVNHEASGLDDSAPGDGRSGPSYSNSFVAIDAGVQFRPPLGTPKPRFYGTMTAFVYAEAGGDQAELDEQGRYRVHLPFDRADGSKETTDPNRKSSHWIRMAQPYVGVDEGSYFPLKGNTEVLLTFIDGDPDRPIISGAVPNASAPALLNDQSADRVAIHTPNILSLQTGPRHVQHVANAGNPVGADPAPPNVELGQEFINPERPDSNSFVSMQPPWSNDAYAIGDPRLSMYLRSDVVRFRFNEIQDLNSGERVYSVREMTAADLPMIDSERNHLDSYVYSNRRTFAYPQHERVYFIGTFHEDFHVRDDFLNPAYSWTGIAERFSFPPPGGRYPEGMSGEANSEFEVNPQGIRGVSEDKRWGDQMTYAWGRVFNWGAGPTPQQDSINGQPGGPGQVITYGNGYAENLMEQTGGTFRDHYAADAVYHNMYTQTAYRHVASLPEGSLTRGYQARGWNPTDPQDYTTEIDTAFASIEKSVGPTFSYHKGFSLDVRYGNSHSRTQGNTYDWTIGDSHSLTSGNSYSHTWGDAEDTVKGDCTTTVHGHSNEYVYGSSHSVRHGATNEMQMGARSAFFLGAETEIKAAGRINIELAAALEVLLLGKIELIAGLNVSNLLGMNVGLVSGLDMSMVLGWKLDTNPAGRIVMSGLDCHV